MEKKGLAAALLLTGLTLSCSVRNPYIDVIQGNYYYGRGLYQSAVVAYLRALEQKTHSQWVRYNLGNVYHSLGESEAAAAMWEEASATDNDELRFHIAFNRGTLMYELGRYKEAYEEFKRAVQLRPSSVETKVNLELSLRKMGGAAAPSSQKRDRPQEDRRREDPDRILDYVRKKETNRWAASEQWDSSGDQDDW